MSLEKFKAEHFQDLAAYEDKGPAWTLFHGKEIVASAGLYILWPGVCEAWLMITPLIYKYPLLFCSRSQKGFQEY